MNFSEKEAKKWCDRHKYTDLQLVDNRWWAIPPHGYIPVCIQAELSELAYWQWWAIAPGSILPDRAATGRVKSKFCQKLDEFGCRLLGILGI